jgi:hypothetical protein
MDVSAVILSAKPVTLELPGVTVVAHVSSFSDATGLYAARRAAIARVQTPHFFFLDDDDALPENYLDVLQKCLDANVAVAYTNEAMNQDGVHQVFRPGEYSQDAHVHNFTLVHHLVLCNTDAARRALRNTPHEGEYGFEPMVYFQMAKESVAWVDEIGYIWNKGTGLSNHHSTLFGMVASATWAHRNR